MGIDICVIIIFITVVIIVLCIIDLNPVIPDYPNYNKDDNLNF